MFILDLFVFPHSWQAGIREDGIFDGKLYNSDMYKRFALQGYVYNAFSIQ